MTSRIRMLGAVAMAGVMAASFAGCTRMYRNVTHRAVSVTHNASNYQRGVMQDRREDYRWDTSVGDITVSTPVFIAVSWKEKEKPLEFSSFGTVPEIIKNIQQAGTKISDIEYRSRELLASLSYGGTIVDNSDTSTRTSGMSVATALNLAGALQGSGTSPEITDTAQLQQILTDVLANLNASGEGSAKGTADIGTNFATTSESKRSESFKTPDIPELPKAPVLPAKVMEKMVALLEGTSNLSNIVHPAELASLTASLRLHMVDMESFYNPGVWGLWLATEAGDGEKYLPYKVHFNVSAETGWYTQLQQLDAVAEVSFNPGYKENPNVPGSEEKPGKNKGVSQNYNRVKIDGGYKKVDGEEIVERDYNEKAYKVVSVVPFESAQALEELDSSLDSMSLALQGQGSGGAFAGRAAYRQLRAIATRLEGTRTNKTLVVGFPDENKVRIRMRAPVVPNRNGRDLQPRSRMFTATILVKESEVVKTVKKKDADGKDIEIMQTLIAGPADEVAQEAAHIVAQTAADIVAQAATEVNALGATDEVAQAATDIVERAAADIAARAGAAKPVPSTQRCLVLAHRYWEPALRLGEYSNSVPNLYPFTLRQNAKQYSRPFIKRRLFLDDNDGLIKKTLVASADKVTPRRYSPIPTWKAPPEGNVEKFDIIGVEGIYGPPTKQGSHYHGVISMRLKGAQVGDVVEVWGVGATAAPVLANKTLRAEDLPITTLNFHVQKPLDRKQPVTVFLLARFKDGGTYQTRMKVVNLTPVNKPVPAPAPVVTFTGNPGGMNVSNLALTNAEVIALLTEVLKNSLRLNVAVP